VATALILAGIYVSDNVSFGSGLTGNQKAEAKNITLTSYFVPLFYGDTNTTYEFGDIVRPGPDYYTYSNDGRSLAVVPLHTKNEYGENNLSVTVDLDTKRLVSLYYDERSPDITYKQQMDAIKIALNDGYIKSWMSDLANNDAKINNQTLLYDEYIIRGVHPSGFGDYGYVNPWGYYVTVPIQVGSPIPPAVQYMDVTVNLANNKTVIKKQSCGEVLMGYAINVTISPGKYFYVKYDIYRNSTFSNYPLNDTASINMVITQQPDNLIVSPLLVDQVNLLRLSNGSSYNTLNNTIYKANGLNWSIWVPGGSDFYLLLKNEDQNADVQVQIPYLIF
jgi:hypothetical protein